MLSITDTLLIVIIFAYLGIIVAINTYIDNVVMIKSYVQGHKEEHIKP